MIRYTSGDEILAAEEREDPLYAIYHENSKLGPTVERLKPIRPMSETERRAPLEPPTYRGNGHAPLRFALDPEAAFTKAGKEVSFAETLARRRSVHDFADEKVALDVVARLVVGSYHVSGTLSLRSGDVALRTTPSAGALHPVELYIVARRIDGLAPGVYHYVPSETALEIVQLNQHVGHELGSICNGQNYAMRAAGAVLLSARFRRTTAKYGERGYRYTLLETGHIAQILCLGAAALDLGLLCHGAFYDDLANGLIGVNGVCESVVYVLLFGIPSNVPRKVLSAYP